MAITHVPPVGEVFLVGNPSTWNQASSLLHRPWYWSASTKQRIVALTRAP